jgi:SH3-like domain-containing protein
MQNRSRRIGLLALACVVFVAMAGAGSAQDTTPTARPDVVQAAAGIAAITPATTRLGPETGFPIPRYVSLRASEANARRGPSRSHRIDWVFQRRNMPMMVVAEHGHWRRVVDRDGAGGWVHYALLSGVRTAIVELDMLPLYTRPDPDSQIRAHAEIGVVGRLRECIPGWCHMEVGGFRGWVDARALWGVAPGEVFD